MKIMKHNASKIIPTVKEQTDIDTLLKIFAWFRRNLSLWNFAYLCRVLTTTLRMHLNNTPENSWRDIVTMTAKDITTYDYQNLQFLSKIHQLPKAKKRGILIIMANGRVKA